MWEGCARSGYDGPSPMMARGQGLWGYLGASPICGVQPQLLPIVYWPDSAWFSGVKGSQPFGRRPPPRGQSP